jgi:hypothetical protein
MPVAYGSSARFVDDHHLVNVIRSLALQSDPHAALKKPSTGRLGSFRCRAEKVLGV